MATNQYPDGVAASGFVNGEILYVDGSGECGDANRRQTLGCWKPTWAT